MEKYFAGIDAGTTGTTVMIFDRDGTIMSSGYAEYRTKHPHPGWVDQDMHELWEGLCTAAKQATSRFKGDLTQIVSIGVSSQRGSFVPVDENWQPLSDAIVWSDGRATKETQWIIDEFGDDGYYSITGLNPSSLWVYPKLKWLKENRPEIYGKTWKFLNGQEWILHNLGSTELFANPSALNYNGMFDIKTLEYAPELFERAGLDLDMMPPIVHELRKVGVVSAEGAAATGFAEGTVLSPGGGDQQCAAVGSGVTKAGMAELSLGTAAVMVAQLDEAPDMAENMTSGVSFGAHAIPHRWDMEGTAHAAGVVLRWWRDTYGQPEVEAAKALDLSPYDLITLEASQAPIGSDGLLFFPFFNSQANPHFVDHARGGMLGLTQIHSRHHAARAVLEGVIYELRMAVESMEGALGRPFDTIRLSGGGAKSLFWSQMQADIYGRPVERLKVSECAVLGAAILGAVGAGELTDIDSAVDAMVHTHGFIEPNMEAHAVYTDFFNVFEKAFLAWADNGVYNDLAEVTARHSGTD
ncbi:xylulose kinase [Flaviflexus salsibiostraticola]|uniref:Xylulose kinase n=1 Tax=Flaviflexus salsibiostraticola TaxID=1282737 RepID=A0A3Q8WUQ3_9ACTO|nr:FGGY family carbohydrate kinase [Flaviflexus salsibiostraticola]AZN30772.1 xylulose kinase [Flaviflexus salsibiostraticola]